MFQQLGRITRQLHDTLKQLGVMPKLQIAADGLPDARSRLSYIAQKTGAAAEQGAELGRPGQGRARAHRRETRRMARPIVADPVKAVASGAVMNFVGDVEAATARIDQHLTDIMMAQDFHDLTGQVVAKVVSLASDWKTASSSCWCRRRRRSSAQKVDAACCNGPVVNPQGRTDVVANQGEVDDLLASLGF